MIEHFSLFHFLTEVGQNLVITVGHFCVVKSNRGWGGISGLNVNAVTFNSINLALNQLTNEQTLFKIYYILFTII